MEQYAILATVFAVATLVIGSAAALTILIRLPSDYFHTPRAQGVRKAGVFLSIGIVLKNVLGVLLVLLGVVLSVPGLPGQGLLTILAGVFLLDFPGKRRLLLEILSRPPLLKSINRVRMKFSRPPLTIG